MEKVALALFPSFQGALAHCKQLFLHKNQIGDMGLESFAATLSKGALPVLNEVHVDDNQATSKGKEAMIAVKRTRGIKGDV